MKQIEKMSNEEIARLYFLGEDHEYLNEMEDELTSRGFPEELIEKTLEKLNKVVEEFVTSSSYLPF